MEESMIHKSADVSPNAQIGAGTNIWNWTQVREGAKIGADCNIGTRVYIDKNVVIGNKVKVQNNASIFYGVTIEDGVFVGPHVCFTNDRYPRAITKDNKPANDTDWTVSPIIVKRAAAIGANSTILPGVTIGEGAMIGAGSVVTKNVEPYTLVAGNPARFLRKIEFNPK